MKMNNQEGVQATKAKIICAALALLGVWCLPSMLNLKGNGLAVSNSYFSVLLWMGCSYLLFRTFPYKEVGEIKENRVKVWVTASFLAFLLSICLAFGAQLDAVENVNFKSAFMWISIIVWTVIGSIWISAAWAWLGSRAERRKDAYKKGEESLGQKKLWHRWYAKWKGLSSRQRAVLMMLFFFLCWIPVFLAVYPGFFVYDAQDELIQVQTRNFSTHHPLFHVLLLGGTVLAGHKMTGSYNVGIAAYTLFQMFLMSGVFTYTIFYMEKRGVQLLLRVASILYFAFFPVIVMFTLCSAKDGIFTAAMLLLLLFMADMVREKEQFFSSRKSMLAFGISAFVMMSFRHNGMYAFLVMVPILLFYMKGYRKKLICLLGSIFVVYFLSAAALTGLLSAKSSGNQEMLTVPIQQLARVYTYDKESFEEEELAVLYEVLPEEALRFYTAKVSDGVKRWFDNEAYDANPGRYRMLWAKIGIRHPFTYLNAWLMTSYGFWYPDTVIDVYRGNEVFTFIYEDSSFFGYEVEQPGVRESKLPVLSEWYRKLSLEVTQQKVPVVSMLFSPGFLFWVFLFAFGYVYVRKRYDLLLPFLMVLLLWLTVILGPTYLPRYVLILWFALPATVAVLVN